MTDPYVAVEFIAESCPEIPFWPQLPQRSEDEHMIEQILGPCMDLLQSRPNAYGYSVRSGQRCKLLKRLRCDISNFEEKQAVGLLAFEKALEAGRFRNAIALKGQVVGPITLAFQLFEGDIPFIYDKELTNALGQYITTMAHWQVERLRQWQLPVLLFLDEPCLSLLYHDAFTMLKNDLLDILKGVMDEIKATQAIVALHCCTQLTSFDFTRRVAPDIISFDAYQGIETFFADSDAGSFIKQGGLVAFGLVPTLSKLDELDPIELFSRWLLAASDFPTIREIALRSMITATCGLGLLNEAAAYRSFKIAQDLAELIKKVVLSP